MYMCIIVLLYIHGCLPCCIRLCLQHTCAQCAHVLCEYICCDYSVHNDVCVMASQCERRVYDYADDGGGDGDIGVGLLRGVCVGIFVVIL